MHDGIPMVGSILGGIAGELAAPELGVLGGFAGSQLGKYGATKLGDYIGSKTGYGFNNVKAHRIRGGHGTLVGGVPVAIGGSFRTAGGGALIHNHVRRLGGSFSAP